MCESKPVRIGVGYPIKISGALKSPNVVKRAHERRDIAIAVYGAYREVICTPLPNHMNVGVSSQTVGEVT